MKKTNFTFFSTMGNAKSIVKSLSLLSMILAFLMGPIAELSALDNPHLPTLKERDRLVESLDSDIQKINNRLAGYNTKQLIDQNMSAIRDLNGQLTFLTTFKSAADANPQYTTEEILEVLNVEFASAQVSVQGAEPATGLSVQEGEAILQDFRNGVFRGAPAIDQYIEYAKL